MNLLGIFSDSFTSDGEGGLFIADTNARVSRIKSDGSVETVAGKDPGDLVAGTPSDRVELTASDITVDGAGNLYFRVSQQVYRRSLDGMVRWYAGSGERGVTIDGILAREAKFNSLSAIAAAADGTLYIADASQSRVFRIGSEGRVYAYAGNGADLAYDLDDGMNGPALNAPIPSPSALAVDLGGNIFISEGRKQYRIVKVDTEGIATMAHWPGGSRLVARSLVTDLAGALYIGYGNDAGIVKVSPDGTRQTLAVTAGRFETIQGLALDGDGNLYVADQANTNPLWKRTPDGSLAALHEYQLEERAYGEGGPATDTNRLGRNDVAVDPKGNLLVAGTLRIRSITAPAACVGIVRPIIGSNGVAHGASFVQQRGNVTPGQIVTVFGANLGPTSLVGAELDENGRLANTVGGMQFKFDGVPAPIVYAWGFQTTLVVPYEVRDSTELTAEKDGVPMAWPVVFDVADSDPGLFTRDSSGSGPGAILNQDGSLNSPDNPAERGSVAVLYGTGEGRTSPEVPTGAIVGTNLPRPVLPVEVSFGDLPGEVLYFGGVPGVVSGVFQANVRIPEDAPVGDQVVVSVKVGSARTERGVTIAIR